MATYVIFTRFDSGAFSEPRELRKLADKVSREIRERCPGVTWKDSYSTMGRFDVVDIVESDDPKQVERAAMIIRGLGRSRTETLAATPWKEFIANLD